MNSKTGSWSWLRVQKPTSRMMTWGNCWQAFYSELPITSNSHSLEVILFLISLQLLLKFLHVIDHLARRIEIVWVFPEVRRRKMMKIRLVGAFVLVSHITRRIGNKETRKISTPLKKLLLNNTDGNILMLREWSFKRREFTSPSTCSSTLTIW